ncbi:hypothetical protein MOQ_004933 [Trypanosoma cruzi marinkellei]|uniref:Uncharacterized protein n=1 Tax=Trypanosoma cruzi marinkellei TaxID=85056 RepID=K2N8W8_TRYCR|nr:hypothetical protein MOQ_004933 [Trypanosoma cruzi marinkellei]
MNNGEAPISKRSSKCVFFFLLPFFLVLKHLVMRWFTWLLLPQKGLNANTRRLPIKRKFSSRHSLCRGTLLAELDRNPNENDIVARANDVVDSTAVTSPTALSASSVHGDNKYLVTSSFAKKIEGTLMAVDLSSGHIPSVSTHSREASDGSQLPSLDTLKAQEKALRTMFADAKCRCIRMQKDREWLREERRAFQLSHGRSPSNKEVSPFVDIELSPIAALKLSKYLSRHSSARDVVVRSILLQQSITRNRIVQSSEKTLFRCLRCFHVYSARPRTLLRDELGHSWMQYEAERKKVSLAKELAHCPQLRKRKYSVGKQHKALMEDPHCCPSCGSPKAQWFMEYVHYRTHA